MTPKTQHLSILLVDDDPISRRYTSIQLRESLSSIVLSDAESGYEAMEVLQLHHFDLIISDHQMPNGTGTELFEFVSGLKCPPPFVLYSSFVPEHAHHWSYPCVGSIEKSTEISTLIRLIEELVHTRRCDNTLAAE